MSMLINIEVLIFCEEYVGEKLLSLFISYTDMKTKYPIQVSDLIFKADHVNPKKLQLHQIIEVLLIMLDRLSY